MRLQFGGNSALGFYISFPHPARSCPLFPFPAVSPKYTQNSLFSHLDYIPHFASKEENYKPLQIKHQLLGFNSLSASSKRLPQSDALRSYRRVFIPAGIASHLLHQVTPPRFFVFRQRNKQCQSPLLLNYHQNKELDKNHPITKLEYLVQNQGVS